MDAGFDSPEDAAMYGFPPKHCCVIASRIDGDDAYVLLNTGSDARPYLYGANCRRKNGRWLEAGSSNGPGWQQTGYDPDIGTLSFWGEAAGGADCVRVEFQGRLIDEPITEGAYLLVWWRIPRPHEWPRVVGFQVDGRWVSPE